MTKIELFESYFIFQDLKHKSVSCGNGKIIVTGKEMSRLFLCVYLTAHYSMVAQKCCRNAENRLILNLQQEKMMDLIVIRNL